MSATPQMEIQIAQSALAEIVKRHREQGHNLTILFQSMIGVGAYGLGSIFGGERAGELTRNVADSQSLKAVEGLKGINRDDPSEEDHRLYVAGVLDGARPQFDRNMLYAQAVLHGVMSIAARLGAAQALETLTGAVALINKLVAERVLRSGDPRKDAN